MLRRRVRKEKNEKARRELEALLFYVKTKGNCLWAKLSLTGCFFVQNTKIESQATLCLQVSLFGASQSCSLFTSPHSLAYSHSLTRLSTASLCLARTTSVNYRTKQANTQPGQTIPVNTGSLHRANSPSTATSTAASLLTFLGKAEFFIAASLDLRLLSDERTSIRLLHSTHSHNV